MPWIDAHNHLQDPRLENRGEIIAAMKRAGVERCVANATREADWNDVEKLADAEPGFVLPAFGIHPWQAHTAGTGWRQRLENLLGNRPEASVGEIGLDGWIKEPGLNVQGPVFSDQLEVARDFGRVATIHCLKAWEPFFQFVEVADRLPVMLLHSFNGSLEIARRLVQLGCYFSFSGHFLRPRKSAVLDVFRKLPRDRILLETDAPDMLPPPDFITHPLPENQNHPANLVAIGEGLARALGMEVADLQNLTRANAARCFGI